MTTKIKEAIISEADIKTLETSNLHIENLVINNYQPQDESIAQEKSKKEYINYAKDYSNFIFYIAFGSMLTGLNICAKNFSPKFRFLAVFSLTVSFTFFCAYELLKMYCYVESATELSRGSQISNKTHKLDRFIREKWSWFFYPSIGFALITIVVIICFTIKGFFWY